MHLLLEGIPQEPYLTPGELYEWLLMAPGQIGMTAINLPQVGAVAGGLAGGVLIAESHITVHYLPLRVRLEPIPEAGEVPWPSPWCAVDCFSCKYFDASKAREWVTATLRLTQTKALTLDRGLEYQPQRGIVRDTTYPWQEGHRP